MDLPHSDACFVRAYPAATAEAWVDGHVHAFAFFAKAPVSVLYDNDRCLVAKILPDGTRPRATLFSGFLSHSLFRDRYGRPGKGNDKGNAEGLVELMRWMPPPAGIVYHDVCGCPLFGKRYLRFSAGSSIGRVSGLTMWPSMTPRVGHAVRKAGFTSVQRACHALEPRV
jgi:hypothetical protein